MATGVGMGLDLEGLDKAIKNAEKGFDNLIKKGQKTQEAIVNNFRIMAEEGVGYFASKLNGISSAFENFGKSASKGMQDIASSSSSAVDKVNHLIDMVKSLSYNDYKGQSYSSGAVAKLTYEIEEAMKKLAQLQEKLNFYATGEGAKAIGFYDTSKIVEEANALQRYIELLQQERHELQQIANIKGFQAEQQAKIDAEWQRMEDERIENIRESAKVSSEAAKAESVAWKQSYEEAYRAYEKLFDKADEREYAELFKKAEANLRQMQKAEAERYSDWLLQKKREEDEHKRIEDEKYKSTVEAIAKQNAAYAELENRRQQNQQVQDNAVQARANYEATIRMYEQMYAQIDAKEKEKERRYLETQKREEDAAARKAKSVIDQANRELEAYRNTYKQRQQMYEQMWREIERRESSNRRGDYQNAMLGGTGGIKSADQALRYADRIYSDRGLRSVNNMQKAIQQMQQAQNRLNLDTEEGKKKYEELGQKIKQVEKDLERLNTRAKSFGDIMKKVGYSVGVYFSISAMKNFGKKLVDVTKEFERQKVALQNLLQSKDEANRLWEKTIALAIKSPYTTKELVTYTKQLAAYRIEHDKLYDTMKMLADVASGLGVDMSRMILAFGQVKAATYLRATELRQFTEAGVNMLDELAKLYSELEGVEVKAGDVFERITKRQVVFGDVEKVFERLTSKGGMFFRMQEEQAKSLYGQWMNLQDIYEISLDEMGRSTRGVMVLIIDTLKTIAENWRLVATAIETVGVTWGLIKLINWIKTLRTVTDGVSKFARAWTTLKTAMLGWQGAVGLVTLALISIWQYSEKLDEVNSKYKELSRGVLDSSIDFEKSIDKIKEHNKAIDELNKKLDKEGIAEKEANSIRTEKEKLMLANSKILQEINNKYPEYLSNIQKEADGTLNVAKALEVMEQRRTAYLILQEKAQAGLFADSLGKNIKDWKEDYTRASEEILKMQTRVSESIVKNQASDNVKTLYKYIKDAKTIDELREAIKNIPKELMPTYNMVARQLEQELWNASLSFEKISDLFTDNAAVVNLALTGIDKNLTLGVGEAAEAERKKAGEAFDQMLDALGVVDEEVIKQIHEFANNISKERFNILLNFDYKVNTTDLSEWQKRYNEFWTKTLNGKTYKEFPAISSNQKEREQVKKDLDEVIKLNKEIVKLKNDEKQDAYTPKDIEHAEEVLAIAKELRRWFGPDYKALKKEENEELKRLKEQIKLVRQLADDYEEMWKKYGKAYADANIKSDARKNAFAGLKLNIDDFAVGSRQDEKNNLGKLLEKALGIEGGKVEVEKAIADVEVELKWDIQQKNDDAIKRELEGLFGDYEISMELEKLNIPPDLAQKLFGVDVIDLTELRNKILQQFGFSDMAGMSNEDILGSERYNALNEEQKKEFADALKKEGDLEQKALEERLKRYSKFLVKGFNERINLKIQELRELEKLEEDKEKFTPQEYKTIKKGIQDEYAKKIAEQEWKDFEQSAQYINLFDNIENSTTTALENMKSRLEELKDGLIAAGVDAKDLKEILSQLNQVEEEIDSRQPFKAFAEDVKSVIGGIKEQIRLRKEEKMIQDGINRLREKMPKDEEVSKEQVEAKSHKKYGALQEAKRHLSTLEEGTHEYEQQVSVVNALEKEVAPLTAKQREITEEIQKQEKALAGNQTEQKKWYKSLKGTGGALVGFGDKLKQVGSFVSDMANKWETAFGLSDKAKDDLEMIAGVAQGAGDMVQGIGSALKGDIFSGVLQGASGIMGIASAIGARHDKKKERQIEAEIKLVKRLQKVYDELGQTIEDTYSLDTLNQATQMSRENLMAQIHATERMIQAEEDKKKTDHDRIEEWKEQIEDYNKALVELEEKRLQELGAFASENEKKSGAQSFMDAWLEAYKETGDGLSGLSETFDEFFENTLKKQMMLRGAEKFLQPFFDTYDKAISDASKGSISTKEALDKINNAKDLWLPQLDEFWSDLAETLGVAEEYAGKNAELSGLSAGVQGITEDTAEVLGAYMNSIRMFVADNNTQLKALVAAQGIGTDVPNPMLTQLLSIAEQTKAIHELFDSVVGRGNGGSHSGAYLKVAIG